MWILISLVICSMLTACTKEEPERTENIISRVESYQGYQRQVSREEYDFYTYFVKREAEDGVTEEEMEKLVRDYANRVNAVFYLANKFQLCEPYSFEVLKMRMEQENELRKVKIENGEAVYGLEQFTLEQFFQYRMDTVEADLRSYLEGQIDDTIVEEAEKYHDEKKEYFHIREKVQYEVLTQNGRELLTVNRQELNFLGNADPGLADFLETGEVGEQYKDIYSEGKREVVIKEISYGEEGFDSNKEAAIQVYVQQSLYPRLIQMVAENNPLEF